MFYHSLNYPPQQFQKTTIEPFRSNKAVEYSDNESYQRVLISRSVVYIYMRNFVTNAIEK